MSSPFDDCDLQSLDAMLANHFRQGSAARLRITPPALATILIFFWRHWGTHPVDHLDDEIGGVARVGGVATLELLHDAHRHFAR